MTQLSSRHLVDAQLADGLVRFPPFHRMSAATLLDLRAQIRDLAHAVVRSTPSDGVDILEKLIPGPPNGPDLRVVIYTPSERGNSLPAYLHIHGGGFVSGAPEIRHASSIQLSKSLGCVVVSVDYRLAPEFPFPNGVEDCYAALRWLHQNVGVMGVDRGRIAIGGESAGGGLAAALAHLARDRGECPVCFQLLIYPMLDHRTAFSTTPKPYAGEFVWTVHNNRFAWSALLGASTGTDEVSPYASAARAKNFVGLPPAFIGVGALDLFLDEDLDYARRLVGAGVSTELHLYPGAFHAFDLVADARVSQDFRRHWHDALRRAFRSEYASTP